MEGLRLLRPQPYQDRLEESWKAKQTSVNSCDDHLLVFLL